MKYVKLGVILLGVMIVLGGCEKGVIPESPNPISPKDVWEGNLSFHTFIWESVDEADYYALQIASDEGYANTVFIDSTIQDTIYKVVADSFVTDTLYYWRVAAGNEAGWSEWSEAARFYRGGEELLISPEDGEVFFRESPIFVWHSYPTAENYVIRVCLESFDITNTVWEDTTSDTTYLIPDDVFWDNINNTGTVTWAILMLGESNSFMWTSPRTFIPAMVPNHYYPLWLGYEWTFEGRYIRFNYENGESTLVKDSTYTFTFSVAEQEKILNKLYFRLEGDYPRFRDQSSPIEIWDDSTLIKMGGYSSIVYVFQPDTFYRLWRYSYGYTYLCTQYRADTLRTKYYAYTQGSGTFSKGSYTTSWTNRLRGVGVISQHTRADFEDSWGGYRIIQAETLVSFTTPDGQIWPETD